MNLSNEEWPYRQVAAPNTWIFDVESLHLNMNEDYEQSDGLEMPKSKSYCSQHLQKGIVFQHVNSNNFI